MLMCVGESLMTTGFSEALGKTAIKSMASCGLRVTLHGCNMACSGLS